LLERVGPPQTAVAPPLDEAAREGASGEVTNGVTPRRGIWNLRSIFARSAERARRSE
jgi:hypothetical protein